MRSSRTSAANPDSTLETRRSSVERADSSGSDGSLHHGAASVAGLGAHDAPFTFWIGRTRRGDVFLIMLPCAHWWDPLRSDETLPEPAAPNWVPRTRDGGTMRMRVIDSADAASASTLGHSDLIEPSSCWAFAFEDWCLTFAELHLTSRRERADHIQDVFGGWRKSSKGVARSDTISLTIRVAHAEPVEYEKHGGSCRIRRRVR